MTIDTIKQLYFISNFYTVYDDDRDDDDFRSSFSYFFLIIIMSNTCSYSSVHWVQMETALYLLVATVNCGTTAQ